MFLDKMENDGIFSTLFFANLPSFRNIYFGYL